MLALEQGVFNAHQGSALRPPPPRSAMAFFSANHRVCQGWFARIRPLSLRAAIAAHHRPLAAHHGLRRLRELEEQVAGLLAARPEQQQAADILEDVKSPEAVIKSSPASEVAKKLLQRREPAVAGGDGLPAMSPTAALLAAATGGMAAAAAPKQQPTAAASRADAFRKSLKLLAGRVFEAAGEVAKALVGMRDGEGVEELRAYCQHAFSPLLQQLWGGASALGGSDAPGGKEAAAAAAAAAAKGLRNAWAWLRAVELHAAGRYEDAIRQYGSLPGASRAIAGAELLAELAAEAYAAVDDWQGLRAWMQASLRALGRALYLFARWSGL